MEDFGGLAEDKGSSITHETQHTKTLSMFLMMKSLFSMPMEEFVKGKGQDSARNTSIGAPSGKFGTRNASPHP